MSDETKLAKEQRCRELLEANPDLSMKEANVTIREEFGAGVAPTTFSKIKKELNGEAPSTEEPKKEDDSKPKAKKAKVAKKVQEAAPSATSESNPKGSDEVSDQDDAKSSSEKSDESTEEAPVQVIEEEEIDPNLPKFPVHLEILVPSATSVHLSGSFNRWRTDELPMTHSGDGFWVFDGELPQGEWHYKFVVDGRVWFLDIHKRKVTDRTGVSHPIQVGEPQPEKEDSSSDIEQPTAS